MTMQHIELTEQDVHNALHTTMELVDTLRVTNTVDRLVARGGFTFNMVFLDGDQPEVRQRFWQLFDHYCSVAPMKEMVWWWNGRPLPFLSDKAREQLEGRRANNNSPEKVVSFRMGSGLETLKMRGDAIWDDHAQAHFVKVSLENTESIWLRHNIDYYGSGPSPSRVRFGFPVSWMREGGDVAGFVKRAVEIMQPLWATAGWGVIPAVTEEIGYAMQGQQRLYPWLERFAGIDATPTSMLFDQEFHNAMSSINWINFVSDPLLEQLGGREAVRAKVLASQWLTAKDVGNCLMVQAGPFPSLCDTQNGMPLPPGYGEAARLLKPIRAKGVLNEFVSSKGSHGSDDVNWANECEMWFSRFDRYGL